LPLPDKKAANVGLAWLFDQFNLRNKPADFDKIIKLCQ
jgi:hypothetical protein